MSNESKQAEIYRDHAADYDTLVAAEDGDGQLSAALQPLLKVGGTLVDVGTGTGRMSKIFAARAGRIVGVEREPAMLEVAQKNRDAAAHKDWQLVQGEARALPVPDANADLVVAGWVFGHFRYWLPDGWRDEVDQAIAEMRRVAKPGAPLVIVESLGTNQEAPRASAALEEYFAHLEGVHRFTRAVVRTDYRFADVETAVRLLGLFFGPDMAAAVRERGIAHVPECTGIWKRG